MRRLIVLPLISLGLGAEAPPTAETVTRVGISNLEADRLDGSTSVAGSGSWSPDLMVLVTVGRSGEVISAEVDADNRSLLNPEPGLAAARALRFKPQVFDGHPVEAIGTIRIHYTRPAKPVETIRPFPPADPADMEIRLERGSCYGPCPTYSVRIRGDGSVRFSAKGPPVRAGVSKKLSTGKLRGTFLPGIHRYRIDPIAVAALVNKFRDASFFSLDDSYIAVASDFPTHILTLRVGNARKRVIDYAGSFVDMPQSVEELEDAVDIVAGTERWLRGNVDSLVELERIGFDFRSTEAAQLAASLVWLPLERRQADLLTALVERGAPLASPVNFGRVKTPLAAVLIRRAADAGDERLFDLLASKGALLLVDRDKLTVTFQRGTGCSLKIAKALLQAGADPKAAIADEPLSSVFETSTSQCGWHQADRMIELANWLIDVGVPIETRRAYSGWSALEYCNSPDLARLLLDRGLSPNARSNGVPVLFSTDDDRVALIFLRAGADPRTHHSNKSVRQLAEAKHWPATLAWLDAHGIN